MQKDCPITLCVSLPNRGDARQWLSCASLRSERSPGSIPWPASGEVVHGCRSGTLRRRAVSPAGRLVPGCLVRSWHGLLAARDRTDHVPQVQPAGRQCYPSPTSESPGNRSGESVPEAILPGLMRVLDTSASPSARDERNTLIRTSGAAAHILVKWQR